MARAGLRARGGYPAVAEVALLDLRRYLGAHDALDAEGALLHPARAAHGDIGIELIIKRLRPFGLEPVEAAHLVRAIVFAVAGADAAVVDLAVESLVGVHRGEHRAYRFARCLVALLAQHRDQVHLRLRLALVRLGKKSIDADPRHDAAVGGAFLADDGDIVFRVTRRDARVAS